MKYVVLFFNKDMIVSSYCVTKQYRGRLFSLFAELGHSYFKDITLRTSNAGYACIEVADNDSDDIDDLGLSDLWIVIEYNLGKRIYKGYMIGKNNLITAIRAYTHNSFVEIIHDKIDIPHFDSLAYKVDWVNIVRIDEKDFDELKYIGFLFDKDNCKSLGYSEDIVKVMYYQTKLEELGAITTAKRVIMKSEKVDIY